MTDDFTRDEELVRAAELAVEDHVCEFCGEDDLYVDESTDMWITTKNSGTIGFKPIICDSCRRGQTWWPLGST